MTRFEKMMSKSLEQMAIDIVDNKVEQSLADYCHNSPECEAADDCLHPYDCCKAWLEEEVDE